MTHKEMMNIKYETCDLWNSLKDKSKIVDTLIDLKEQNLKLKTELAELKQNAIVPEFKVGDYIMEHYNKEIFIYKYIGNLKFKCLSHKQGYHCNSWIVGDLIVGNEGEYMEASVVKITKAQAEEVLKKLEEK
jgi:hypothetical protein